MIFKKLNDTLLRNNVTTDTLISVAFSGGPDSVFLAYGLVKLGYKPILIYINYHDSVYVDKEEQIVNNFASLHNLIIIKKDTVINSEMNFENEARRFRYDIFRKINNQYGIKYLLTAHQFDDLIETYIMQKRRNNLVDYYGLKEISNLNSLKVFRPALNYTKKEMKEYLIENMIPFFDDPTNNNLNRERNLLRTKLNYKDFLSIKEQIDKENVELARIERLIKNNVLDNSFKISFYKKLEDNVKRRVLYALLKGKIGYQQNLSSYINIIFERLKSNKSFKEKIKNYYVIFDGDEVKIIDKKKLVKYKKKIEKEGIYIFPFFDIKIELNKFNIKEFPITIRNVLANDIIATNIVQNDANNFIKKMRVPLYLREYYPVICDKKGRIIYVPYYEDILKNKINIKLDLH